MFAHYCCLPMHARSTHATPVAPNMLVPRCTVCIYRSKVFGLVLAQIQVVNQATQFIQQAFDWRLEGSSQKIDKAQFRRAKCSLYLYYRCKQMIEESRLLLQALHSCNCWLPTYFAAYCAQSIARRAAGEAAHHARGSAGHRGRCGPHKIVAACGCGAGALAHSLQPLSEMRSGPNSMHTQATPLVHEQGMLNMPAGPLLLSQVVFAWQGDSVMFPATMLRLDCTHLAFDMLAATALFRMHLAPARGATALNKRIGGVDHLACSCPSSTYACSLTAFGTACHCRFWRAAHCHAICSSRIYGLHAGEIQQNEFDCWLSLQ
jgi:hypothetical protein